MLKFILISIKIEMGDTMIDETVKMFKSLADHSRLKILASLLKEPMYVELISERLSIHPSTTSFHLKKLEQIGFVTSKKEQYYTMYYINKERLNMNIMGLISTIEKESHKEEDLEEIYYNKIKDNFFKDGKLLSIPVQRKKRQVILKEIAKSFEFNKEYPEKEVNLIISEFHYDFCTIRREFIMNKMFSRENGIYTRLE